jgi:tRNA(Ile)-lysidine synthase
MTDKVLKYVREQDMLKEGDLVVAGVSGGADSVCLLFVLLEIKKVIPIKIEVVHINHMIREDAVTDARYVEDLCREYDIPFILVESDVEEIARKEHISTEEAGRNVRYNAFYRVLGDRKGKIAIAHNKNDCCETFLFNLFRGAALKGLTGIRPTRDKIIRPLLCVERGEIEEYLDKRNIRYCTDSTNLGDDYTRNKIRHHILAKAVDDISHGAVGNISKACDRINEAYELISDLTAAAFDSSVKEVIDNNIYKRAYHIEEGAYNGIHKTLQGYVVMEVLKRVAQRSKDLESVHVREVKGLFDNKAGARISLPYKMTAIRDYKGVMVCIENEVKPEFHELEFHEINITRAQLENVENGGELKLPLGNDSYVNFKIQHNYEKNLKLENIPQKKCTKWFDYDKIKGSIVIRTRRTGDYITVNSKNQRKLLKAYFTDEKLPKIERDKMLLLANESHIIWILGARISNYYKITKDTVNILCVEYVQGCNNG